MSREKKNLDQNQKKVQMELYGAGDIKILSQMINSREIQDVLMDFNMNAVNADQKGNKINLGEKLRR